MMLVQKISFLSLVTCFHIIAAYWDQWQNPFGRAQSWSESRLYD